MSHANAEPSRCHRQVLYDLLVVLSEFVFGLVFTFVAVSHCLPDLRTSARMLPISSLFCFASCSSFIIYSTAGHSTHTDLVSIFIQLFPSRCSELYISAFASHSVLAYQLRCCPPCQQQMPSCSPSISCASYRAVDASCW
jgi:hypothetical protein